MIFVTRWRWTAVVLFELAIVVGLPAAEPSPFSEETRKIIKAKWPIVFHE